jgi:hypothetical protein
MAARPGLTVTAVDPAAKACAVSTSESTLRFRHRDEVTASLVAAGYLVDEVRQAPDRPGRELVFIARRADVSSTGT